MDAVLVVIGLGPFFKTIIENNKKGENNMSKLFSIFGARESKDAKRVNISLVTGKDDNREWASISIAKDGKSKTKVEIKENRTTILCIVYPIFRRKKRQRCN